jgi:hypothetical protein
MKLYSPVAKEKFDSFKSIEETHEPCMSIGQTEPIEVDCCKRNQCSQIIKKDVSNKKIISNKFMKMYLNLQSIKIICESFS